VPINVSFDSNSSPTPTRILSSKYIEWKYEEEVRILQPEKWYNELTVKRVIAGGRIDPSLFKALGIICEARNIILSQARIENYRIYVDDPPINETTPQLCE
jgi:hypothetical protein